MQQGGARVGGGRCSEGMGWWRRVPPPPGEPGRDSTPQPGRPAGGRGTSTPVTSLQTGCGEGATGPGMWERKMKYAYFRH